MEFQQKQIWLINFDPSFGHECNKVRPGLIIENDYYIQKFDLQTIIPISSNTYNLHILDIIIPRTSNNRLMKDSVLKTKQINSFDKRRFIKLIGLCDNEIFAALKQNILSYLS